MEPTTPETIALWGGTLALDLANSVDRDAGDVHVRPELTDVLLDPGALRRWGERLGLSTSSAPPARELAEVRELRESIYRVFAAIAREGAPPAADLDAIRAAHAQAAGAARLARRDGAWRLDWPASEHRLVRFAAAADAVELLADGDRLARVSRCPGRDCGWLFLDTSGRRRWCSMSTCGSREKMRRMAARRAA